MRPVLRTPTPGPELDLVQAALHAGLGRLFSSKHEPHVLMEPEIAGWYPDIVLVYPGSTRHLPRRVPSKQALQLLHEVYRARGISIEAIEARSYHRRRDLMSRLAELEESGFISGLAEGVVRCKPKNEIFSVRAIISIEAKIRDWRRAINQAQRNSWFASASYVLLPDRSWTSNSLDAARLAGVGAIGLGAGRLRLRYRPTAAILPTSYGSWYAAFAALHWSQDSASSPAATR